MEKKYIFFDIDGTLTDENPGGNVLPSTIKTLGKLRSNGHYVAIATGRARNHAWDFASSHGFNNMVCDGGNGVVINGEVKWIKPMDYQLSMNVINECLQKGYSFGVSLDDSEILYYTGDKPYNDIGRFKCEYIDSFKNVKEIFKIFINITVDQECELPSIHKLGFIRYFASNIVVEPLDKYSGIVEFVKEVNGNIEDIVVFGDGKNDISMVRQAPVSIAMGNAIDELKQLATFVTKRNDDDGIEYACKHFGWID